MMRETRDTGREPTLTQAITRVFEGIVDAASTASTFLNAAFERHIQTDRRTAHVLTCIRAGYAAGITDEEAHEAIWSRYKHNATALAAVMGDWCTARAYRELDELLTRLTARSWREIRARELCEAHRIERSPVIVDHESSRPGAYVS